MIYLLTFPCLPNATPETVLCAPVGLAIVLIVCQSSRFFSPVCFSSYLSFCSPSVIALLVQSCCISFYPRAAVLTAVALCYKAPGVKIFLSSLSTDCRKASIDQGGKVVIQLCSIEAFIPSTIILTCFYLFLALEVRRMKISIFVKEI